MAGKFTLPSRLFVQFCFDGRLNTQAFDFAVAAKKTPSGFLDGGSQCQEIIP